MALNDGLDVSFENMQDWEGTQKRPWEVNLTKVYITNNDTSS
jgi:hypothetical protein